MEIIVELLIHMAAGILRFLTEVIAQVVIEYAFRSLWDAIQKVYHKF
ncbi:hypothetical protein [uncultured Chryseobacterium sp.]|nr:hypothetical protein [uncultured Chryseobacterium sp.]